MAKSDIIVIGGGPAGSAAAIRLAGLGLRVDLFEKARFPRPKLCGGFISGEVLDDLAELDVLSKVEHASRPIHRIVLATSSGHVVDEILPRPSLSLSRDHLDQILLDQTKNSGVRVTEGADGFSYKGQTHWTVIATGRNAIRHSREKPACRQAGGNPEQWDGLDPRFRGGDTLYYGLQSFFDDVNGITDQVELDLIANGYVGMVAQSGHVNVCMLVNREPLQSHRGDLDGLMRGLTRSHKILEHHLAGAKRVSDWQAVGPVRMGLRQLTGTQRFFVGDAACVVDPFVGEGIAMGLRSSKLLARAFDQARDSPEHAYETAWHREFDAALRIGSLLRQANHFPALQNGLVRGMQWMPRVLRQLALHTRPSRLALQ